MKGVKHYKKDGTVHTGATHKMPDGSLKLMKHKGKFVKHKGASLEANFAVQKVHKK